MEGEIDNYCAFVHPELALPLPITRRGGTYKIVNIYHVNRLAKSVECNDIRFFTTENMSNSYECLLHNIA
jgi:hypothetical protein